MKLRKGEWGVRGECWCDKAGAVCGLDGFVLVCVCMLEDSVGALLKGISTE